MRRAALSLAAVVLYVGSATVAGAKDKTIASPLMYLSTNQYIALCTIRNIGKDAISLQVGIYGESGNLVTPDGGDTCNGSPLEPGKGCLVESDTIPNGVAFACTATAPQVKYLRGEMMLRDDASDAKRSAPLR